MAIRRGFALIGACLALAACATPSGLRVEDAARVGGAAAVAGAIAIAAVATVARLHRKYQPFASSVYDVEREDDGKKPYEEGVEASEPD